MQTLANLIERELQFGKWDHCAIYKNELERIWPADQEGREAKIAQFAREYGFHLQFYRKGLCAIFVRAK